LEPEVAAHGLRDALRRLDHGLLDLVSGAGAPEGFDPGKLVDSGAHRVRPLMVLLSARAARAARSDEFSVPVDGPELQAEQVAIAAELLQIAITIHDAAIGHPGGRRRRAARRLLSGAVGWLGGNHLTLRALELVRSSSSPEVIGDLLEAMREISELHALVHALEDRKPTLEDAVAIADGYSGAVFSFACRAGARMVGAERRVVSALGRYGRHAGLAWHLAEELECLDGDADEVAEYLEDFAYGRPNLALSLAAAEDPQLAEDWLALRAKPGRSRAGPLARRFVKTQAGRHGRRRLAKESWAARRALSRLTPSPHRESLDRIAAGLAK